MLELANHFLGRILFWNGSWGQIWIVNLSSLFGAFILPKNEMRVTLQALENCLQEQARLRAQVHLLETRVKQQRVKIEQLLHEKEVQFLDKGEENSVIDLGGKRQYAGQNLCFLCVSITYIIHPCAVVVLVTWSLQVLLKSFSYSSKKQHEALYQI